MVCYDLLARLDPAQSCLKVTKNLPFSAKIAENKPFLLKKANSSDFWDDFTEELDVLKRPFKKLQNVGRSSKKDSMFNEQYFLYLFKVEN